MSTRNSLIALVILLALGLGLYKIGAFEQVAPSAPVAEGTAKDLRDEFIALGYPTAETMPTEFEQKLLAAYNDGDLYTINALDDGYVRKVALVSVADTTEVNYEYCGMYSEGLCFIVYELDGEQEIVKMFVGMRGAPLESYEVGHVALEQFLADANGVLYSTSFGDGPGGYQKYLTLDLDSGEAIELAKQAFGYDGDSGKVRYVFTQADQEVILELTVSEVIDDSGATVHQYTYLTMSDAGGYLVEEPLILPVGFDPFVSIDPILMLNAPEKIIFTVPVRAAVINGDPGATRVYQYDALAKPRLTVLREIP